MRPPPPPRARPALIPGLQAAVGPRKALPIGYIRDSPMTVALLSIGTELTRGEIVNTNAAWLAAELTASGFNVAALESVPDDLDAAANAVARLARGYRLVIVTGGLGPTTDDLTTTTSSGTTTTLPGSTTAELTATTTRSTRGGSAAVSTVISSFHPRKTAASEVSRIAPSHAVRLLKKTKS